MTKRKPNEAAKNFNRGRTCPAPLPELPGDGGKEQVSKTTTKKPNGKIRRLIARHLREKARGSAHYSKADLALQEARRLGLEVHQQVEVTLPAEDGSKQVTAFELVDNFQGESAFRSARIPHFELKKVPKFKREKADIVAAGEVAS
jgi:hypothetical protein